MKQIREFLKQKKNVLIIALLLALLVAVAFLLYGGKSKVSSASANASLTPTEIKLTRILSEIEGVGKAEVMINEGSKGIEGVIIVCEGAYNIMTRNDIINAVATALGVDRCNIAIYAMTK